MILRKPYAFFIKYFRIINLTMAILMGITMFRTWKTTSFFVDYVNDYSAVMSKFSINDYSNFYNFVLVLLIIVLTIIVLSVVVIKNKPAKLYVFNLILYIAVIVFFGISYSIFQGLYGAILDIRITKSFRDIGYIIIVIQLIGFIMTLIRSIGFDMKSFDFITDLQELEIDAKDNEEFELTVEFDRNSLERDVRKGFRNTKYFYVENKTIINIALLIVVIISGFIFYITKGAYITNYSQGKTFAVNSMVVQVNNSYITEVNQRGGKIISEDGYTLGEDRTLLVVRVGLRQVGDNVKTLNTGTVTLKIGRNSYPTTTKYHDDLTDLGTGYIDQKLLEEFKTYILVFDIPKTMSNKSKKLKINDQVSYVRGEMGAKNFYVKLKPEDLSKKQKIQEFKLGETIDLKDSVVGSASFKIEQFSIGNKFQVSYNFCSLKNKCTTSYEYVTPTATGRYAKTLMKIDGIFEEDPNLNLTKMNNMYYFLNNFGTIYFQIEDKWYSRKISSVYIKPQKGIEKGITYIEIDKDAEKAKSIYLMINIRNSVYKYSLK